MVNFPMLLVAFISSKVPENIEHTDFYNWPDQVAGETQGLNYFLLRLHKNLFSIPANVLILELLEIFQNWWMSYQKKFSLMFSMEVIRHLQAK